MYKFFYFVKRGCRGFVPLHDIDNEKLARKIVKYIDS